MGTAIKAIYRDIEYARTLIKKRGQVTLKGTGDNGSGEEQSGAITSGSEEGQQHDAEEWTLVDNDSDPDAASPMAMMQPKGARSSSRGGRRRSGVVP